VPVEVKICGINAPDAMRAAVDGGADYVGLVFYPPSPRAVTPEEAGALAAGVPAHVMRVGLFVDADDDLILSAANAAGLQLLQLHGSETPDRIKALRDLTGLPVMKAIKVAGKDDVDGAAAYLEAADRLLFDAKAPADMKGALPGGNALAFDWTLLSARGWPCPWMLSGGLDAGNVAEAVRISGAWAVDVSSGVESAPGRKDIAKIRAFIETAKRL
jgi:phosphoribosylanthranilate isomerase